MTSPSPLERLLVWYAREFPVRRGKLRVVEGLWRLASGSGDPNRMSTLVHGGFEMPCNLNWMLQRQYYFFGSYFQEEALLKCWERTAKNAKIIFDVGANAGIYSLAAAAAEPGAIVHAFEPTPEIAERLVATAQLNCLGDRLRVHDLAVGARNGYAALRRYSGEAGTNEGMNYVHHRLPVDESCTAEERVRMIALDSFCAEKSIERVDLMKLDVQGQEYSVLLGAQDLIAAGTIGTLFMELNWSPKGEKSAASDSIRLLAEARYLFAEPGQQLQWREAGDWLRSLNDAIARHPDSMNG